MLGSGRSTLRPKSHLSGSKRDRTARQRVMLEAIFCAWSRSTEPAARCRSLTRFSSSPPKTMGLPTITRIDARPMAPEAGFEPATWALTVPRSTAELLRIKTEFTFIL
jgi:hypothetical protein